MKLAFFFGLVCFSLLELANFAASLEMRLDKYLGYSKRDPFLTEAMNPWNSIIAQYRYERFF